jgi:hypothetical protein
MLSFKISNILVISRLLLSKRLVMQLVFFLQVSNIASIPSTEIILQLGDLCGILALHLLDKAFMRLRHLLQVALIRTVLVFDRLGQVFACLVE